MRERQPYASDLLPGLVLKRLDGGNYIRGGRTFTSQHIPLLDPGGVPLKCATCGASFSLLLRHCSRSWRLWFRCRRQPNEWVPCHDRRRGDDKNGRPDRHRRALAARAEAQAQARRITGHLFRLCGVGGTAVVDPGMPADLQRAASRRDDDAPRAAPHGGLEADRAFPVPTLHAVLSNAVAGNRFGTVFYRVTLRERGSGRILRTSNPFKVVWYR